MHYYFFLFILKSIEAKFTHNKCREENIIYSNLRFIIKYFRQLLSSELYLYDNKNINEIKCILSTIYYRNIKNVWNDGLCIANIILSKMNIVMMMLDPQYVKQLLLVVHEIILSGPFS